MSEHENAIRDTAVGDYSRLAAWYAYLQFEEERSAPRARIRALYERAIVRFFLVGELWTRYSVTALCLWSISDAVVRRVHERAVRNVSFSSAHWRALIDIYERAAQSHAVIAAALERSVAVTLGSLADYVVAFDTAIDYFVRRLRDANRKTSKVEEDFYFILRIRN